ncbi:outer membrane lipoprotein [Eubacteriaceae bacterium CHKCI004]|nr:outer membrane lipoprotein [Eubacteriaceae bacterium CHKCI004]
MHFKIRHGLILVSAVCLVSAAPVHARAAYKPTAKTVCLTKTSVHMRKGPGLNYPVQTTIQRGARVKKIGTSGSWSAVKANGSVSYIKSRYLKKLYKVVYVSGNSVNLRTGPGTTYSSIAVVPQNTKLKCLGKSAGWAKVKYKKRTCYISSALTSSRKSASASGSPSGSNGTNSAASSQSADAIRSKAIAAARARLGDLYSQSKRNFPGYADCSSLLRDVFLSASGVNIGETTSGQIARLAAYKKPFSSLQAGDILMRIEPGSNHAALYIGNCQYIHASSTRGRVIISTYYPTSTYWTCCYDAAAYCSSQR